jgi:hypothetical protein
MSAVNVDCEHVHAVVMTYRHRKSVGEMTFCHGIDNTLWALNSQLIPESTLEILLLIFGY